MLAVFVITFRYDQILIKDGLDPHHQWTGPQQ